MNSIKLYYICNYHKSQKFLPVWHVISSRSNFLCAASFLHVCISYKSICFFASFVILRFSSPSSVSLITKCFFHLVLCLAFVCFLFSQEPFENDIFIFFFFFLFSFIYLFFTFIFFMFHVFLFLFFVYVRFQMLFDSVIIFIVPVFFTLSFLLISLFGVFLFLLFYSARLLLYCKWLIN